MPESRPNQNGRVGRQRHQQRELRAQPVERVHRRLGVGHPDVDVQRALGRAPDQPAHGVLDARGSARRPRAATSPSSRGRVEAGAHEASRPRSRAAARRRRERGDGLGGVAARAASAARPGPRRPRARPAPRRHAMRGEHAARRRARARGSRDPRAAAPPRGPIVKSLAEVVAPRRHASPSASRAAARAPEHQRGGQAARVAAGRDPAGVRARRADAGRGPAALVDAQAAERGGDARRRPRRSPRRRRRAHGRARALGGGDHLGHGALAHPLRPAPPPATAYQARAPRLARRSTARRRSPTTSARRSARRGRWSPSRGARRAARARTKSCSRHARGRGGHGAAVELVHARRVSAPPAPRPSRSPSPVAPGRGPQQSAASGVMCSRTSSGDWPRSRRWPGSPACPSGSSRSGCAQPRPAGRRARARRSSARGVEAPPDGERVAGVALGDGRAQRLEPVEVVVEALAHQRAGAPGRRPGTRAGTRSKLAMAPDHAAREQHRAARAGRPSRAPARRRRGARASAAAARPAMPAPATHEIGHERRVRRARSSACARRTRC